MGTHSQKDMAKIGLHTDGRLAITISPDLVEDKFPGNDGGKFKVKVKMTKDRMLEITPTDGDGKGTYTFSAPHKNCPNYVLLIRKKSLGTGFQRKKVMAHSAEVLSATRGTKLRMPDELFIKRRDRSSVAASKAPASEPVLEPVLPEVEVVDRTAMPKVPGAMLGRIRDAITSGDKPALAKAQGEFLLWQRAVFGISYEETEDGDTIRAEFSSCIEIAHA